MLVGTFKQLKSMNLDLNQIEPGSSHYLHMPSNSALYVVASYHLEQLKPSPYWPGWEAFTRHIPSGYAVLQQP